MTNMTSFGGDNRRWFIRGNPSKSAEKPPEATTSKLREFLRSDTIGAQGKKVLRTKLRSIFGRS